MKYDYLLKTFLSTDFNFGFRPIQVPHTINGFTYATDSHILIKVPSNKTKDYPQKESPHFEALINQDVFDKGKSFILQSEDLFLALAKIQIAYAYGQKKCEKCEGNGYKTCECCEHENDCKECDGTGGVEDRSSVAVRSINIRDEYGAIKSKMQFGNIFMSPVNADILAQTMIFTKCESVEIFHLENKAQIRIDDIFILIMLMV